MRLAAIWGRFWRDIGARMLKTLSHAGPAKTSTLDFSTEFAESLPFSFRDLPAGFFPSVNPTIAALNTHIFAEGLYRQEHHRHHIHDLVFPDSVLFRTMQESFNRHYQFVLRAVNTGGIERKFIFYKKHTGGHAPWVLIKNPAGMTKNSFGVDNFCGISADDQYLVAINEADGRIYSLLFVDDSMETKGARWTDRWGFPFWHGKGDFLPRAYRAFTLSCMSTQEQLVSRHVEQTLFPHTRPCFVPPLQAESTRKKLSIFDYAVTDYRVYDLIGEGVVTFYVLEADGQHIRIYDPWLRGYKSEYRTNDIRKILTPKRGRIKGINLCAAASTMVLLAEDGRIYTRFWDFDTSGGDDAFISYSTSSPLPRQLPNMNPETDLDWWERQPDLPSGTFSSKISIVTTGSHSTYYIIWVEAQTSYTDQFGATHAAHGFYYKYCEQGVVHKSAWKFFPLGAPLESFRAFQPIRQRVTLASGEIIEQPIEHWLPHMFAGREASEQRVVFFTDPLLLEDFNPYEGPARISGTLINGDRVYMWLHNIDPIRTENPRYVEGLSVEDWPQKGYLQLSKVLYQTLSLKARAGDRVCEFFLKFFNKHSDRGHFVKVELTINIRTLTIKTHFRRPFVFNLFVASS